MQWVLERQIIFEAYKEEISKDNFVYIGQDDFTDGSAVYSCFQQSPKQAPWKF